MAITQSTALMSFEDILSGLAAYTLSYTDALAAATALYTNLGVADAGVAAKNWLTGQGYETAGAGPAPGPGPGDGGIGGIGDIGVGATREDILAQMEASQYGRRQMYGGYLQGALSPNIPESARAFAESRFAPLQARWQTRQAMNLPGSFSEYLGSQPGKLSPQDWQARVGQVAGLYQTPGETEAAYSQRRYGTGAEGGWDPNVEAWMGQLAAQPEMGYDIALQSVLPRIHPAFRGAYSDYAARQWDAFQSQTPDAPFLPYFQGRGYRF